MRLAIALAGCGRVGRMFLKLLQEKSRLLKEQYHLELKVVTAVDIFGAADDPKGLDIDKLVTASTSQVGISGYPGATPGMSGVEAISRTSAQVLVEAGPTNIQTGEPGLAHFRAALARGMHVVTLSKGPLVVAYPEISSLAKKSGVVLKFSGATAAALPTTDIALYALAGCKINRIMGILNGTTNYILTRMTRDAVPYEEALKEAQAKGIAEPDPSLDVEGWDTASKILILANAVMEANLTLKDVDIEGIAGITLERVKAARAEGKVIKLMGEACWEGRGVKVNVRPQTIPLEHTLAGVSDAVKAVHFETDVAGDLTVIGGRSDPKAAAAAALKDVINLSREIGS